MSSCIRLIALMVFVCAAAGHEVAWAQGGQGAPVRVRQNRQIIGMDNGIVRIIISKHSGEIASIYYEHGGKRVDLGKKNDAMYFDSNGGPANLSPAQRKHAPHAGYQRMGHSYPVSFHVVRNTPQIGEVVLVGGPSRWFPFRVDVHYVLKQGMSGFYAYAVYHHGSGMRAAGLGQTRFALKGPMKRRFFTHYAVDDKRVGAFPKGKPVRKVQDATYEYGDGKIYTKYNNTVFLANHHVHGVMGHGLGMWMVVPSHEYVNGGPTRQDLTVHQSGPILISLFVSGHFGGPGVHLKRNEVWNHCYGPIFVYLNHGSSIQAMWKDAKARAQQAVKRWPYQWVRDRYYPTRRGTVKGQLKLTNGKSTKGAWVILAQPGSPWWKQSKGYEFWTQVKADGSFAIPKVRPGKYALYAYGANQFQAYEHDGVVVTADRTTNVGLLKWKPITHGQTIWQIGTADRSTQEFRGGDNVRNYGNFLRYPKQFPDDVTYVVGKSKPGKDWNFAQWSWYCKKPYWTVKFPMSYAVKGKATLTFGIAAADPPNGHQTRLRVAVNGKRVGVIRVKKTGAAAYRSGGSDTPYNVRYITFDASLLHPGMNEMRLGFAHHAQFSSPDRHRQFGAIMCDAIRLEIAQK